MNNLAGFKSITVFLLKERQREKRRDTQRERHAEEEACVHR